MLPLPGLPPGLPSRGLGCGLGVNRSDDVTLSFICGVIVPLVPGRLDFLGSYVRVGPKSTLGIAGLISGLESPG